MKFALFHGFIVTANEDGSIPTDAKIVAHVDTSNGNHELLCLLIGLANREDK